jgi:hypothetical protein
LAAFDKVIQEREGIRKELASLQTRVKGNKQSTEIYEAFTV